MPRECFKNWSDADMEMMFGTTDSDLVSVEDVQRAVKVNKQKLADTLKQASAIQNAVSAVNKAKKPNEGVLGLLTRDPTEQVTTVSLDQRISAIRSLAKSEISDFMSTMSPKFRQVLAGIATGERSLTKEQDRLLKDLVHELYGNQTGNADAQKAAKGWLKATEKLNKRFENAGGHMAELDDWRLPQKHDRMAIAEAGEDAWVSKIWNKLDTEKMLEKMRKKDATEADLEDALRKSYHNIVTDGASNGKIKSRKLKDMMRNERFLTFKDADSWLAYQKEFGENNIYASMLGHVDYMGRAIGVMETFGPDPDEGFRAVKKAAAAGSDKRVNFQRADDTYEMMMGYNTLENQSILSQGIGGMRNMWVASKLGSAVVAALTDTVYAAMGARYNGLSPMRTLNNLIREIMNPATSAQSRKQWAQDFGLAAEFALDRMTTTSEYAQSFGGNRTRNLAESVMIASGMNRWTQSARAAFQFEFASGITRALDSPWDKLPSKTRSAMERYGISEADWKVMQEASRSKFKGAEVLNIKGMEPELQTKLVGMIDAETLVAVPTPDARVRSLMMGGGKAGTFAGELHRSLFMFHSFPVSTIMNQWRRVFRGQAYSGSFDRFSEAAIMLGVTTTLGVGVIQAKEILNGKTPMEQDDPKLWIKGMAQGGGFNYLGDFVNNAASGFKHDTNSYIGGPVIAHGDWLAKTGTQMAKGEYEKAWAGTVNHTLEQLPAQNLWYSKLATDRLIMDRIKRMSDPEYDKKQLQKMRNMRRDDNQEYWWKPPVGGR